MGNFYIFFQKQVFPQKTLAICLLLLLSFFSQTVLAQTPGLIIRKGNVTGGAPTVSPLDPNGDGWVSATSSGFSGSDLGTNSEINYVAVPAPPNEPTGDLRRGSSGFFSEIVDDVNGNGFYFNSDGVNLRFRMRIGGLVPGAKGYSALIDSDGKFGFTGPNADPNAVAGNPGFEYEVVYESSFRVAIYRVDGATSGTLVTAYNLDAFPNHAQIAVAATADGGDPDYFYDWYVPISAFASEAVGIKITDSTPLRMTPTTVMSPQGAVGGPASDAYGDDNAFKNINDQWGFLIENQAPITPDGTNAPILNCTAPTRVNAPVAPNPSAATTISGLWTANAGAPTTATIEVFRTRTATTTSLGTIVATSGAQWDLTGLASGTLQNGDIVYATSQSSGLGICGESNQVLVQNCTPATRPVAPTVSCFTTRGAGGTGIEGATVRIYILTPSGLSQVFSSVLGTGGAWGWDGTVNGTSTGNAGNVCGTGSPDVADGTYIVTQTVSGCESEPGSFGGSQYICIGGLAVTATPTITQANIAEDTQTLSGTAVGSSTVHLIIDGLQRASTTATAGGAYSFPISSYVLQEGQTVSVRSQATGQCISAPETRTVVQGSSFCNLTTPTITTNDNGNIAAGTQITGFSSEAAGTTVTVYNNATNAVIGTALVQATTGAWTLTTPTAVGGTSYYARHTGTSCGTSERSNTATTLNASTVTNCGIINGPVSESVNPVTVTGSGIVNGTTVRLFIDGAEIGNGPVSGGNWSITVNDSPTNRIYSGGVLTITVENAGQLPNSCTSGPSVTVQCVPPAVPSIATTLPINTTSNNFSVTISNSVSEVLYYIVDDQNALGQTIGTQRGVSQFGNGGSLTLTSSSFLGTDGTYKFRIVANPLSGGASCNSQSAQFDVIRSTSVSEVILPDFGVALVNLPSAGTVFINDALSGTITYSTSTVLPNATLTLNGSGSYSFIATQPGVYEYTINVCTSPDVPPACPESILTITVIDPGIATNPPVANKDHFLILEGGTLNNNVLTNDQDLSGTGLTVTELNGLSGDIGVGKTNFGGSGGTLTLNANGTFSLTNPTTTGTFSFNYTVCDAGTPSGCSQASVEITVYPSATANIIFTSDDYKNTQKSVPISGNVLTNDSQLIGTTPLFIQTPDTYISTEGTIILGANGDYTFTPNSNFSGKFSVIYLTEGTDGVTAMGTLHITVYPFIANQDVNVAFRGSTVSGNVNTNDDVPAGSIYTNTSGAQPNATLTLNPNGTYTFMATVVGVYTYNIQVCAPTAPNPGCETKTLTITVTDPASAANLPVANNDIAYTLLETAVIINAIANDKAGNPTNTLVASTADLVGTPAGVVDNGNGTFTYTPAVGFTGIFTFQYTVEDNESRVSNQATVTINVYPTGSQNAIIANDDYASTIAGSPLIKNAANGLLVNDGQLNSTNPLVAVAGTFTNTGQGTLVLASDGSYTFTPSSGFVGTTQFPYTVSGTNGAVASGTAYFTVSPKIVSDINVGFTNISIPGNLSTNDVVQSGSVYGSIVAGGSNPNANLPVLAGDGSYTFTTALPGVYTFSYNICPPNVTTGCYIGTLTITVLDPADAANPPVANTDNYVSIIGSALSENVIDNDVDFSGSGITVTALNGAALAPLSIAGGTLTLNSNGTFTLTGATTAGTYSFNYTITDGNTETATATVYITVYQAGTPNVVFVADDYVSTSALSTATGNVLTNDSQLIGTTALTVQSPGTFTLSGGNLTLNANGSFSFIPNPTFSGTTSHAYTAVGTDGAVSRGTVYFTVSEIMLVNPDIGVAFINNQISGNVITNDVVPTGSTYTTSTIIAGATLNLNSNGSYTFTATVRGVYTYNVQACTPGTTPICETKTLTITVTDPALLTNAPVANNDIANTLQNTAVVINVLANDQPGVPNNVTKALTPPPTSISTPANGTAVLSGNNILYTPAALFIGTDSFTYQICDAATVCSTATVFVTVYATGTPNMVLAADDYSTTNGITPVSGNVLTNDTQLSGAALTTVTNPGTYSVAGKGSLVLNANGTFTFTPVAGAEGVASFVYTVQGTDGATASATLYVSVYPPVTYTWIGGSTDWCDPANWDRGAVPVAGVNVTIPSTANDPVFDVSTCPVCINDLTIASGVTVGLTGKLCVTGDLDSQGNVVGAGSISLEGTTPQTITGQFNINNLELNNLTGGATITSGAGNMVNITESIKLTAGTLTTNDNLRLVSDASGDAYFAPISDAECLVVNIVGNVRVQKFVDGGNRAFRFIAHPFDGTLSLQQVRDYVHITGSGLDFNSTGNPSAFWYVTSSGNQAEEGDDTGWVPVSSTNIGEWFKGRAVRMLFRGPRIQGGVVGDDNYVPQDVTYELIGSVNLCEQILVGLRRVGTPGDLSGAAGNSAFNFIGNPYPAAINLKTIPAGDRTNIGANYYLWQPRTGVASGDVVFGIGAGRGGSYFPEPFGSGPAERGQLAIGTGFFVVANVDLATIRFTEANKLSQKQLDPSAAVTFRTDDEIKSSYGANTFQLAIHINGEMVDRVLMFFDENTSGKVDIMDATKFENPLINFFTVSEDDYAMAIDRRPWVAEGEYRIPLHILSPAVKYTLTVPDFDMESGRELHLYDRHLDKLIRLAKGATYEFEVTAEQATKGHRFDIVMGVEVITSIGKNADRFQAFLLPNPAQQQVLVSIQRPDEIADTHVRLLDVKGVVLYQSTIKADDDAQINYELGSLAKGVYLVEITHGKQRIVKRLMVN